MVMKLQDCSRIFILQKLPWFWVPCTVRWLWLTRELRTAGHRGAAIQTQLTCFPAPGACGGRAAPGTPSVSPLDTLSSDFAPSSALPLRLHSASLVGSPEGRDGHPLDLSLASGWRHPSPLLQDGDTPSPRTLDRANVPVPELAGASPLVRDATEPTRGLRAKGRAVKQGNALSLLDPMGFWLQDPWQDSQPGGILQ